jgi:adenylate cyclase
MNAPEGKSYSFDRFVIDTRSSNLRRQGKPVPLRPKSYDALLYLVRNAGRLVSKDELIEKIWPNVIVTENSLAQCIKDIRQALDDDAQTMLETVAKRGYLFAAPVTEIDAVESQSNSVVPMGTRSRWKRVAFGGIAAALLVAGGLLWALPIAKRTLPSEPAQRLSIAVLAFTGSELPATDDYFSTGMSEDIASALGRFPDLAVASPKLVMRFQSVGANADDIRRQLNIQYLVEGSIRRMSGGVRILVRLTDLPRGTLLWSNTYDVPAENILAVQDEIAVRIAGALAVKLTNLEGNRALAKSPGNMEAYDYVLRGRQLLTRLNRTSYSQARAFFDRAVALDPRYAAGYIGLGRVDLSAIALGWTDDAGEALKRAENLARKAISLDEFNPAGHVLLGRTFARMGEYDRAVDALKRAVALNPSEPDSYAGLGDALLWNGEPEKAIKALETAVAIDPSLSAEDLFDLGTAYFLNGNIDAAIRVFERITIRNEGNPFIYAVLAAVYADVGRDVDAQSAAIEVRKLNPFFDADRFGSLFKNVEHRGRLTGALKKAGL